MTHRVLLRCDSTEDLYPVTTPSLIPRALLVSQHTWHQRLGHPGSECDHGGEFDHRNLHKLFAENGIQFRFSCPYTSQQNGVDVDETFSPVVNPDTIQTVLRLADPRYWPIHQLDVKNAFLHGDLSEMIQDQGPTSGIRANRGTLNKKNHKITNKHSPTILYKMSQPANDEFSQHLSDDEESNHEDASDTGAAPKQQQQVIPQTTAISNIKLPILKKEEYDIWAMEMEHYLEYIDNDVWKVIQNGNSKKRISTGKDGIVRILSPVTAAEIQAVEKERKAKNILLMAIPKEHMRRFHGMDDAKEIWEAIRTRFGGNANSKKMQKAVFKQQFEAFKISSSEGLEKGYDRFQQLLSQLKAHGAKVSTEDANHKFLRSLPPAWSNLVMTVTPPTWVAAE
ncbi:ribonuclease H-like domain-containing protein [Tanacetum coccineum]